VKVYACEYRSTGCECMGNSRTHLLERIQVPVVVLARPMTGKIVGLLVGDRLGADL